MNDENNGTASERVASSRRHARAAREALPDVEQSIAARAVRETILVLPEVADCVAAGGAVIAGFSAFAGEVDLSSALLELERRGCQIAMPLIVGSGAESSLEFRLVGLGGASASAFAPGPFGIPEPARDAPVPDRIDIVLNPLVAFDTDCRRIGMGRGYYDRAFGAEGPTPRPLLIGVAHDVQEVDEIPDRPWDVRLDVVVTPTRVLRRA